MARVRGPTAAAAASGVEAVVRVRTSTGTGRRPDLRDRLERGDERHRGNDHLVARADPERRAARAGERRGRSPRRRSAAPAVIGERVFELATGGPSTNARDSRISRRPRGPRPGSARATEPRSRNGTPARVVTPSVIDPIVVASGQYATAEPSVFLSYARVVSRIASYALVLAILAGVTSANHPLGPAPARAAVAPRLAVSPSGSDMNDCTTACPCTPLARAFGVARAGDVVSISGGEYPRPPHWISGRSRHVRSGAEGEGAAHRSPRVGVRIRRRSAGAGGLARGSAGRRRRGPVQPQRDGRERHREGIASSRARRR